MAAAPDPWDECAGCGHDRDDHDPNLGCFGTDDCACLVFEEGT
jgi:hypothetical protein